MQNATVDCLIFHDPKSIKDNNMIVVAGGCGKIPFDEIPFVTKKISENFSETFVFFNEFVKLLVTENGERALTQFCF